MVRWIGQFGVLKTNINFFPQKVWAIWFFGKFFKKFSKIHISKSTHSTDIILEANLLQKFPSVWWQIFSLIEILGQNKRLPPLTLWCEDRVPNADQNCSLWWHQKTSGKRSKILLKISKNYFWKITQILICTESRWFLCHKVPLNKLYSRDNWKSSFSKNRKSLIVFTLGNHRPPLA